MDSPRPVFISYAHQDTAWAQAVCAALEADGQRCWMAPRDMKAGVDWPAQIVEAISGAALMVLILSERSNQSPQVLREVDRAVNRGVNVLALRLGEFMLSRNLEYFISMCHWLDATGLERGVCLAQVCANARAILAQGTSPAPAQTFANAPPAHPPAHVPPTPAVPQMPAPGRGIVDAVFLKHVEAQLAMHLGPIARHLVRQAAGTAHSNQDLLQALAGELANERERQDFLLHCRQIP